jgi:hypothetical protein
LFALSANELMHGQSRVARFFLAQHPKRGKSIPKGGKIYQIAIEYAKWPENLPKR